MRRKILIVILISEGSSFVCHGIFSVCLRSLSVNWRTTVKMVHMYDPLNIHSYLKTVITGASFRPLQRFCHIETENFLVFNDILAPLSYFFDVLGIGDSCFIFNKSLVMV